MKAISLWQPWASLMADERKKIETRRGCIVAIGEFFDWLKFDKDYKSAFTVACQLTGNDEWRFGDFEMGRFGWFFALKEKLNPPIAATGHQGIWSWERRALPPSDEKATRK